MQWIYFRKKIQKKFFYTGAGLESNMIETQVI